MPPKESNKIKSFTVKENVSFAGKELYYNFVDGYKEDVTLIGFIEANKECFDIEYDIERPTFPNGAQILEPKLHTEYFYKNYTYPEWDNLLSFADTEKDVIKKPNVHCKRWGGTESDRIRLAAQDVFLEEDKCLFNNNLQIRHLEIAHEVYKINAENNWTADWSDEYQKKYICYLSYDGIVIFINPTNNQNRGIIYFCKKAKEYLETLSIEDQKAFLLIY